MYYSDAVIHLGAIVVDAAALVVDEEYDDDRHLHVADVHVRYGCRCCGCCYRSKYCY